MTRGAEIGVVLLLLASACAMAAVAQAAGGEQAEKRAAIDVIRVIDDPHTGARWLLERDMRYPGGPGRMVLATRQVEGRPEKRTGMGPVSFRVNQEAQMPVIRRGDRLVVEESTAVVEARLEAVALENAPKGARLKVRLTIGGRLMQVVALGPRRAVFLPEAQQ